MTDETSPILGNGADTAADTMPQVATIAQYVKDLSVEAPNSPASFQWQTQPQLDVEFNIGVNQVAEDVHEVVLKINTGAKSENGQHFLIELAYAGLFAIRNMPEEALPFFLLAEAPRLIFPFARQVVADAVQNAGFPPLLLDPIDFTSAYLQQAGAQGEPLAGDPGVPAGNA